MGRKFRTLLFSTLYPSSERPLHGIFVETRLRELLKSDAVETRVVAPVPWFYSTDPRHGDYAAMARTPARERREGIEVWHPRYVAIPRVGMSPAPLLLAMGARATLARAIQEGFDFDLIDAHYYYPDGVAAALLARWFRRPFIVTARGSDVNQIGEFAAPRAMIRWAARRAHASVAVSRALAQRLVDLGAPADSVQVLSNGVDTDRFRPEERMQARARLGLGIGTDPLILSVGNLLPVKRHDFVIEALAQIRRVHPRAQLAVVGAGPLREGLAARARELGLAQAVHLVGAVEQPLMRWWYSAADVLALASTREGWPNVLLEALACGTAVVASRVGGVAEILDGCSAALAIDLADPQDLADALLARLGLEPDRDAAWRHAQQANWSRTSEGQLRLFESAVGAVAGRTRQGAGA